MGGMRGGARDGGPRGRLQFEQNPFTARPG